MKVRSCTILVVVIMFLDFVVLGQSKDKSDWSGVVCDSSSKTPLPFSTIIIKGIPDSALQYSAISNEDGRFQIVNFIPGYYHVECRYVGFKTFISSRRIDKYNEKRDTISLSPNSLFLSGIEITASVFTRDIDKLVMNTSQIKLREGSNTIDLLKEVPGVTITYDNNISILGKDVMIMMDGKPIRIPFAKLSNLLRNQSSNDIGRIEIMFTPPPKYVDEWDGSILNIISKKKLANGFYGNIINLASYGKHFRDEFGLDLNYRRSHFNTFLSFGPRTSTNENTHIVKQSSVSDQMITSIQQTKKIDMQKGYYLSTGLNFMPNKKNSIDFLYKSNLFKDNSTLNDSILNSPVYYSDSLTLSKNDSYRLTKDHEINLFYRNILKDDDNYISFEADYSKSLINYDQNRVYSYFNLSVSPEPLLVNQNRNSSPFKSDMVFLRADHCLSFKKMKIESGLKWNLTRIDNNLKYANFFNTAWVNDSSKSNHYKYDENIFSAYTSFGQQVTTKLSYKVAIRGSYTFQSGESVTSNIHSNKSYFKVLPSLFLAYVINEKNQLTSQYDRILKRPNYVTLNPFIFYDSPASYIEGNPYLDPSTLDRYTLIYMYKSCFFITLSYSDQKDWITLRPVVEKNSDKIVGYKYENFSKQTATNLSVSYKQKFFQDRFVIMLTPTLYYSIADNPEVDYNGKSINYFVNISLDYTIDNKTGWEIGFYNAYMSGFDEGYNHMNSLNKCGTSMSRSFLNNSLKCSIELNDIFNSENRNSTMSIANVEYKSENIPDSRYFRIALYYSFNSKGVEQYNKHEVSNEERSRIK